jgi:hypothetical protein
MKDQGQGVVVSLVGSWSLVHGCPSAPPLEASSPMSTSPQGSGQLITLYKWEKESDADIINELFLAWLEVGMKGREELSFSGLSTI